MNKWNYVFLVGSLLLVAGAFLYLTIQFEAAILFSVGAALIVLARIMMPYQGDDFRIKRLVRMQYLATLLYLPTAYFMFQNQSYWFLCFLIAAMLEIVVAFRK